MLISDYLCEVSCHFFSTKYFSLALLQELVMMSYKFNLDKVFPREFFAVL